MLMIRNRSRSVARNKQPSMATDHQTSQPPPTNQTKPIIQSLLASPRFKAFISKSVPVPESDPVISPTSILDSVKRFSALRTPFQQQTPKIFPETKQQWEKKSVEYSKGIGVVLITESEKKQKPIKLRIQIPPPLPPDSSPPPESPAEFGIRTRISSPQLPEYSTKDSSSPSPRVFTECLSANEMELSEDYTCVISRGANPKTTHIFDNCIVENYFGVPEDSVSTTTTVPDNNNNNNNNNFLSICYTCKKSLEQKGDIFIYRGEKAFCSGECRYQEMVLDGGLES